MAETAMNSLVENLAELIVREANVLIGVEETVKWIGTEFRVMVAFLQSIDQLPQNANDSIAKMREVILRAEDVIETYAKRARQAQSAAFYRRPLYWMERRDLSWELAGIKDQIVQVRQGWRSVNLKHIPATAGPSSSSQESSKLDSALHVENNNSLELKVVDCIKWVRDELAPLQDFLREIDRFVQLGERQKIWVQELRDVFQFIDESFPDQIQVNKWRLPFSCFLIQNTDPLKLKLVAPRIQEKIIQFYRRYYTYGFGEILVDNGSRSIFPRIRMNTPIPFIERPSTFPSTPALNVFMFSLSLGAVCMCVECFFPLMPAREQQRKMTLSSWLMPNGSIESLGVDLKLMKALLEDTRSMGDLDERAKVWLSQIQEISVDLAALQDEHSGMNFLLYGRKIDHKLRKIRCRIRDVAIRKMTYGIGSALGEAGFIDSIASNSFNDQHHELSVQKATPKDIWAILEGSFISKAQIKRGVELVKRELQLMQALFEDVKRMEKLEPGLKVWVEEMLGLARQANDVVEADYKSFHQRIQADKRIKQVYSHICAMSLYKHTYNIGDIKPRQAGFFNHINLIERDPYSVKGIKEELLQREMNFMQTLVCDVEQRDDELDRTAKAWFAELKDTSKESEEVITSLINKGRDKGLARNLDRVMGKIRQLSEIRIAYGIELKERLPPYMVKEIKVKLLSDLQNSCIIPILGMKHVHKEALQELIDNDNTIKHHFDWHAWVYVPKEVSATSNLEFMTKQIREQQKSKFLDVESTSKAEGTTEEELVQMLQELLMHKRCLIVLDEIETIEVWHYCLERAFQRISTGSRIILITNERTCSLLNSSSNAIVRELPSGSGDVLPSYLFQCLLYFLLFPASFEVPTRRLIVLWVAEGLVRAESDEKSAEHVAAQYLTELIERKIVCVTQKKLNGKVKSCKLSDDIRDGWLMKAAEDAGFFRNTSQMISRLVDHHDTIGSCFIQINGNANSSTSVQNYKKVLSFLSFDTQEGSKPGVEIGNFLHKCISAGCFLELRMLDLEKVFRPKLPKALSKLILLKYLGLRWTYLEILPEYVKELFNLQVLDVKHTYISILPKSIWKMQFLRHLYLSETYRTRFAGRPSSVSLTDLQTLWGAFIDETTMVKGGLDTVLKIRKLGLSCQPRSSQTGMQEQLKVVACWISKLEFLEILRLKSRDEDGKASQLHLETLASNQKLSTVYLLGKLQQSVVPNFPVTLVEITLSGSELPEDPMKYLENLPYLLILRLLAQSVMCPTMHCSSQHFPKLNVLKIWKLENLMNWEVEEGALPSLEELEIRACDNLTMLPDGLQHVKTLKKFTLTSMPEAFINETKIKQSELWAKIVPQVE